jgi:hypothetical protein
MLFVPAAGLYEKIDAEQKDDRQKRHAPGQQGAFVAEGG